MWRVGALCLGVTLSLPASAATLNAIQGQVLINHGDGFQRVVASGAVAREGDLVMANPGGSANLVYPGGCVTQIKPGTVVTVNDGSKCPMPMLVGQADACDNNPDPKERDRCWCWQHHDDPAIDRKDYRVRCGIVWWPWAAGAAVAAAIAVPIVVLENDDHHHHNKNGGGGSGGGGGGGGQHSSTPE